MRFPHFQVSYEGDRELLSDRVAKKGDEGIKEYWVKKSHFSLDGIPTHILKPRFSISRPSLMEAISASA